MHKVLYVCDFYEKGVRVMCSFPVNEECLLVVYSVTQIDSALDSGF